MPSRLEKYASNITIQHITRQRYKYPTLAAADASPPPPPPWILPSLLLPIVSKHPSLPLFQVKVNEYLYQIMAVMPRTTGICLSQIPHKYACSTQVFTENGRFIVPAALLLTTPISFHFFPFSSTSSISRLSSSGCHAPCATEHSWYMYAQGSGFNLAFA